MVGPAGTTVASVAVGRAVAVVAGRARRRPRSRERWARSGCRGGGGGGRGGAAWRAHVRGRDGRDRDRGVPVRRGEVAVTATGTATASATAAATPSTARRTCGARTDRIVLPSWHTCTRGSVRTHHSLSVTPRTRHPTVGYEVAETRPTGNRPRQRTEEVQQDRGTPAPVVAVGHGRTGVVAALVRQQAGQVATPAAASATTRTPGGGEALPAKCGVASTRRRRRGTRTASSGCGRRWWSSRRRASAPSGSGQHLRRPVVVQGPPETGRCRPGPRAARRARDRTGPPGRRAGRAPGPGAIPSPAARRAHRRSTASPAVVRRRRCGRTAHRPRWAAPGAAGPGPARELLQHRLRRRHDGRALGQRPLLGGPHPGTGVDVGRPVDHGAGAHHRASPANMGWSISRKSGRSSPAARTVRRMPGIPVRSARFTGHRR